MSAINFQYVAKFFSDSKHIYVMFLYRNIYISLNLYTIHAFDKDIKRHY